MATRRQHSSEDDSISQESQHQQFDEKHGFAESTAVDLQVDAAVHELAEKLGDNERGLAPVGDIELVVDKVALLTVDECRVILEKLLVEHTYDYNFSEALRIKIRSLLDGPQDGQPVEEWELELKTETAVNHFYSPYPEVRAITAPVDDPTLPCETFRAHLLGYIWACAAQFVNSLFNSRYPQISITSQVIQVLLYPCGHALAFLLPDWGFTYQGTRYTLNPGPWTYKEQTLSTIIVDVGLTSAYCFSNIQTQSVYYGDKWLTPGYGILLLLSTQMMGLGFSGLLRRYVIYPVEAIWPSMLPTLALNRALLVPEKPGEVQHGWKIKKYTFFWILFAGSFAYFWLPGFVFPALAYFAWMAWISPNNFNLAAITGSQYGLGFNPWPTWDWNVISQYSYPLTLPFFAYTQQFIGTVLGGLIIIGMYWSNYAWTGYLPINSSGIFDNTGQSYNISRVVDPATGVFNETAYQDYSPAYYTAANLLVYGAFFAFYPLTMVFVVLDFWRPLVKSVRSAFNSFTSLISHAFKEIKLSLSAFGRGQFGEGFRHAFNIMNSEGSIYDGFDDPFTNMMRAYPEVPDWWFLIIALISFIFAIIILTNWEELNTPVWTIFFVIALNLVFLIPMTYLYAVTGVTEGLNVVTELVIGYALPGHPEALMFVKAYGYNINGQADNYISDQKMGFYAKVPPRAMYRGQVTSAFITALVCYGVVQWVDETVPGICSPDQPSSFTCANGSEIYFASSVIWGAIGPKRIFDTFYPVLQWTFLIGFLLALVWWAGKRFGHILRDGCQRVLPAGIFSILNTILLKPLSKLKHVHPALLFNGMLYYAPLNLTYFTTGFYLSYFFMYYLRRYKTGWWERYNYLMSAALTAGVALAGVIIFFAVQYPTEKNVSWWGVDVTEQGVDGYAGQSALYPLPPQGYFT